MKRVFSAGMILGGAFMVSGCSHTISVVHCNDPDTQCYINATVDILKNLQQTIALWSNWHFAMQVLGVTASIVATIMIALQSENNKSWTRPIGLVATALVTGLSSALTALHVPQNVDRLIGDYGLIASAANAFEDKVERLTAGMSDSDVKFKFQHDKKFKAAYDDLSTELANHIQGARMDMLRLYGTAPQITEPPVKTTSPQETR